ncbi:MAG: glucosaminidase domain-containing protein [Bacteroidota bacterium]
MQLFTLNKKGYLQNRLSHVINWLQGNWTTIFLCFLIVYLLARKNITLQVSLKNSHFPEQTIRATKKAHQTAKVMLPSGQTNWSNNQKQQLKYVQRFAKTAQGEMQKFGIPASITLAQGLLESNAGRSPLAHKSNNHFGIKCFSKKCAKGHCTNFNDDSHKDFFRNYTTPWESYRAHSLFLQGERYQHLLDEKNYKNWAYGLAKAGYATDPKYAEKLIQLIEELGLDKYDV